MRTRPSRIHVQRLAAVPALASTALLTACSGAKAGTADPGAAGGYLDKTGEFIIGNGKLVVVIVLILLTGMFLKFLWGSAAVKVILALLIGGTVVYFATKGGR